MTSEPTTPKTHHLNQHNQQDPLIPEPTTAPLPSTILEQHRLQQQQRLPSVGVPTDENATSGTMLARHRTHIASDPQQPQQEGAIEERHHPESKASISSFDDSALKNPPTRPSTHEAPPLFPRKGGVRRAVSTPNQHQQQEAVYQPYTHNPATSMEASSSSLMDASYGNLMDSLSSLSSTGGSRDTLRRALLVRRQSLTLQETAFLTNLCINGDEVEIELACNKLQDTNLFFEPPLTTTEKTNSDDSGNEFWDSAAGPTAATTSASERMPQTVPVAAGGARALDHVSQSTAQRWVGSQLGNQHSARTITVDNTSRAASTSSDSHPAKSSGVPIAPAGAPHATVLDDTAASRNTVASGNTRQGSERRAMLLERRRRNSEVFDKMWKAHESGLAVSQASSRRVSINRNSGFVGSTRHLLRPPMPSSLSMRRVGGTGFRRVTSALNIGSMPPGEENQGQNVKSIFRYQQRRNSIGNMLMDDIRSDNNRRTSFNAGRFDAMSPPRRSSLRRMQSEGSRKSVTFKDLPPVGGVHVAAGIPPGLMRRSSLNREPPSMIRMSAKPFDDTDPPPLSSLSSSSIPPIQSAHPILGSSRSTATAASSSSGADATYPSLRMAKPLSTQSFQSTTGASSISSTSSFSEDRDPSESLDEKKTDFQQQPPMEDIETEELVGKVPSKVLIPGQGQQHHQQQQRNASQTDSSEAEHSERSLTMFSRPVLLRRASQNIYDEEGIEVADWRSEAEDYRSKREASRDPSEASRRFHTLASFGEQMSLRSSNSFDESISHSRMTSIFRRVRDHPGTTRSYTDDDLAGIFLGNSRMLLHEATGSTREMYPFDDEDDDASWKIDNEEDRDFYDAWKVIEDEYENGYGGAGTLPFHILGTSADDVDSCPHVLSPPLMESLQNFLPYSKSGENFWMKFSLLRDGASYHTLLQHARGAKHSFLAIETVDGEVFGAFTSEPWRKNWNYFGSNESFLWRMRQSRREKTHSIIDQAQLESEIDVFPFTGYNRNIQLCTQDRIAVGSGFSGDTNASASEGTTPLASEETQGVLPHHWGFGLTVDADSMLFGTTSPCLTFGSPSLSTVHSDGTPFEIINMELWTLTPYSRLEDAEKLELGKLFLEKHLHPPSKMQ